jgi:para-nitrobenzyl esterase
MNFKIVIALTALGLALHAKSLDKVNIESGPVKGAISADGTVRMFKGIPYAAPPVGALRWRAPQPVASWTAVRDATAFGARCMQGNVFGDMMFRDAGPSEDCLYLNVWSPIPKSKNSRFFP